MTKHQFQIILTLLSACASTMLAAATFFDSNLNTCYKNRTEALLREQYFSTIQSGLLGAVTTAQILGKPADPKTSGFVADSLVKTQADISNIFKNDTCNRWNVRGNIALITASLLHGMIIVFTFSYSKEVEINNPRAEKV